MSLPGEKFQDTSIMAPQESVNFSSMEVVKGMKTTLTLSMSAVKHVQVRNSLRVVS